MAHFAHIKNNIVKNVIVINNSDVQNKEFPESESIGQEFIASIGLTGEWKQTSYNGNFRGRYANIGDTYDKVKNVFIPPKPFDSWILDENTYLWKAPVNFPEDGNFYIWNEDIINWEKPIVEETEEQ